MARQPVIPGKSLDIPTREEIASILGGLLGGPSEAAPAIRAEAAGKTDASGNLTLYIYTVPAGWAFRLTRLFVIPDSATFGNPFNGAGAYLQLLRNDIPIDGVSLVAAAVGGASLPVVLTEGITSAAYYANGDQVGIQLVAGPTSVGVTARIQGELITAPNRQNGHAG